MKRRIDELDTLRKKVGACWALAIGGVIVTGATLAVVAFSPAGAARLHPAARAALFAGLWLHQVGGLAAVVGVGTTWASFWVLQAVALNKRLRIVAHELRVADSKAGSPPTPTPERPAGPPQSEPAPERFTRIHIDDADLDIPAPAGWTHEHVDGVDLFLPADETRPWPLNMQVQAEPDAVGAASEHDRLHDVVQGYQADKAGFRLEDSAVLTEQWGAPAVTCAFTHHQADMRLWTRLYVLFANAKAVTLSTTVLEQDRVLMETIFEDVTAQLRSELGARTAAAT